MSQPDDNHLQEEVTLDAVSPLSILRRPEPIEPAVAGPKRPRFELVDGDTGASTESVALVQTRLRAAAFALGFGFVIFEIWMWTRELTSEKPQVGNLVFAIHAATTATLIGVGIWLARQRRVSVNCLAACELIIFGLPAIVFAVLEYQQTVFIAQNFDLIPSVPVAGWILRV